MPFLRAAIQTEFDPDARLPRDPRRLVPVGEFVVGARKTVLEPDELVIGLRIPTGPAPARATFEKLGARRYLVISIVMAAAVARFSPDGRIAESRIAGT